MIEETFSQGNLHGGNPTIGEGEFIFEYKCRFLRDSVAFERDLRATILVKSNEMKILKLSDGSEFHLGRIQTYPAFEGSLKRKIGNQLSEHNYWGFYPSIRTPELRFTFAPTFDYKNKYLGNFLHFEFFFILGWIEEKTLVGGKWFSHKIEATETKI